MKMKTLRLTSVNHCKYDIYLWFITFNIYIFVNCSEIHWNLITNHLLRVNMKKPLKNVVKLIFDIM